VAELDVYAIEVVAMFGGSGDQMNALMSDAIKRQITLQMTNMGVSPTSKL
jgi:hypothetical protein